MLFVKRFSTCQCYNCNCSGTENCIKSTAEEELLELKNKIKSQDIMYGAVQWINNNPILNGMPIFDDKESCLKYIEEYKLLDKQFPGFDLRWTIIELKRYKEE